MSRATVVLTYIMALVSPDLASTAALVCVLAAGRCS